MRASSLDASACDSMHELAYVHTGCLSAADEMARCIRKVNRQSRTASETTARNVRSQLDECEKLLFGMKPWSTAFDG